VVIVLPCRVISKSRRTVCLEGSYLPLQTSPVIQIIFEVIPGSGVIVEFEDGYEEIQQIIDAQILMGQRSRSPDLCWVIVSCFLSLF
jgi:hypothetical protein